MNKRYIGNPAEDGMIAARADARNMDETAQRLKEGKKPICRGCRKVLQRGGVVKGGCAWHKACLKRYS